MKKIHIIAWLDAAAFALFTFLLTTGILLYYRLPPGSGRWKYIWHLNRRDWGDIHFWMAMAFICIVALHLYLHKNWIVSVVRGKLLQTQRRRLLAGVLSVAAIILLALLPLLSGVDTRG